MPPQHPQTLSRDNSSLHGSTGRREVLVGVLGDSPTKGAEDNLCQSMPTYDSQCHCVNLHCWCQSVPACASPCHPVPKSARWCHIASIYTSQCQSVPVHISQRHSVPQSVPDSANQCKVFYSTPTSASRCLLCQSMPVNVSSCQPVPGCASDVNLSWSLLTITRWCQFMPTHSSS